MKLDTKYLRYLATEDWRVLAAVEQGSKNHEIVPTPLIEKLSGFRGGSSIHKSISTLAKANLIARTKNAKYDGYRLTYGGLDYLSLHTSLKRNHIYSLGNRIGVGKESDIYVCASPSGVRLCLKLHRLGRISFRTIKNNRDYLRHRSSASWMHMSRLAAQKEYTFMKALRENGMAVPEPVAWNRHTIVMELMDAFPLRMIKSVPDPAGLYAELMEMIMRLAGYGLIHGDFNEFNILIREDEPAPPPISKPKDTGQDTLSESQPLITLTPILIDFPQMVSVDHANAEFYFNRDVHCIKRFFERRFHFTSDESGPFFADARKRVGKHGAKRLDVEVEASGFSKKMAKELEKYMREVGVDGDGDPHRGEESEEDDDTEDDQASEDTEINGSLDENLWQGEGDVQLPRLGTGSQLAISSLAINDQT